MYGDAMKHMEIIINRAVHWCRRSPYLTSPVWYLEIYKLEWSKYVSLIKFLNFDRCVKSFLCLKMTKYGFWSISELHEPPESKFHPHFIVK